MHEFGLASDILATALAAAGDSRLARVHVDIGPDIYADPGILRDAFGIAAGGTAAEEAILELTPVDQGGVAVTAVEVAD